MEWFLYKNKYKPHRQWEKIQITFYDVLYNHNRGRARRPRPTATSLYIVRLPPR